MRKLNIAKRIVDVLTDKELRFVIMLFLISLYLLITAVYSYGKVDLSELKHVEGTISNIEVDYVNSTNYVTFTVSDTQRFYMKINGLKNFTREQLANTLECTFDNNGKATVFYTNRRVLLPRFYSLLNYHRVVAIQSEDETIISVDDYNMANRGRFIGGIVCSLLFFAFAVWLIKW